MLLLRKEGLRTIYVLTAIFAIPVFFLLGVVIAVEVVGIMGYWQVNFPLYLLGVFFATVLRFHGRREILTTRRHRFRWVHAVHKTNGDLLFLALALFAIIFATKDQAISRIFVGCFLGATWVLLLLFNRFAADLLGRLLFRGENLSRAILVGRSTATDKIRAWVADRPSLGLEVAGLLLDDPSRTPEGEDFPVLGTIADLERVLEEHRIDQVILLDTRRTREQANEIFETSRQAGARVLIFNHWEEHFEHPMTAINEGSLTFFTPDHEPLQNPFNRLLKRILDLAVAIPVVILLLPPLMLIVKLVQLRQAPGPLFYLQIRNGQSKRPFPILKFRTMYHGERNAGRESEQARVSDDRIYPFGQLLRRTSLDEIPQFVNVLMANMSVVGPRPHLIAHDDEFDRYVDYYRRRHFTKPGITGMAQHLGFRGEITEPDQIRDRVHLDLEYIYNWSFWLDIGIIVKTAWHVLFPPAKAY